MVPTSIAALSSLNDVQGCESISQINPFLPKILSVDDFVFSYNRT